MEIIEARVLHRPENDQLRFLPEGPYPYQPGRISWVGIQHGADSTQGSINVLDLNAAVNRSTALHGRPGFAFPTTDSNFFVAGVERRVCRIDIRSGESEAISEEVDTQVANTVINDGVAFDGGIVFGCKHLEFSEKIAGLYLWRSADRSLVRLRDDQICSNGKIMHAGENGWTLLDIDSPTKQVVRCQLDVERGELSPPEVVLDLTPEDLFPDGMVATPDGEGVIIAFYNPNDHEYGVAREFDLSSGEIVTEWRCPRSPQVTCPQLIEWDGAVQLVLTTAVEHMTAERQAVHTEAGSLFVAETRFSTTPVTPTVPLA